jgi:hypothetical protein
LFESIGAVNADFRRPIPIEPVTGTHIRSV